LCDRDGRLVLTDFGAGCELVEEEVNEQVRELAGTPVCVAPEILAGQPATPRSDVYSLGVLLYHLVTGTYPVLGRSLKEVREAHAHGTRTPLGAAQSDLPSAFVQVVDRALSPNPDDRYGSPDAFGSALSSLVPPGVDGRARAAIGRRRRWKSIAIGAVLAVAAAFGSAPLWWASE